MSGGTIKLTIELVPQTAFFKNVRSKVSKGEWDIIRRKAYKESGYKCKICGGVGKRHPVECHEIWEYKNGVQKLIDFIALCPNCHSVKHYGLSQMRGLEDICREHLARVNNVSLKEVDNYVAECWEVWAERSKKDWELDVSLIKKRNGDLFNAKQTI